MSPLIRNGLVAFIAALILVLGALIYQYERDSSEQDTPAAVAIGGPFTLTDQNGATRHDSDFRGKLMLVYFGYTFCPDVCPTTLATMTKALEKLGPQATEVVPVFVTVDPDRDTVAQLKLYASNFAPDLVALTGTQDQIAAAANAYRVYYRIAKPDKDGDPYTVDHTSFIYLMGRDGKYLGHFDPNVKADTMAATIGKQL